MAARKVFVIDRAVASRIKLVAMDVDGTLTDGGLFIGSVGGDKVEFKRFDIQDGLGIKLLKDAGLLTAMITGRAGDASRLRAEELKVDEFVIAGGSKRPKLHAFEDLLEKHGVAWAECCFIGDDLIDIPIMRAVGLPVAVGNAVAEVKACAAFTTRAAGGHGAVREFIEAFLTARGVWAEVVENYVRERAGERVT